MKPIGGFFELELETNCCTYHSKALALSTARACLNLIIQQVTPKSLYIPYYTCDSVLEPILANQIKYQFYNINRKLELANEIILNKNEYLLFINYFGLKTQYIKQLINQYGNQLILDNTQAFFERSYQTWSFNSARKFFGVPDGAYLYTPYQIELSLERNTAIQCNHLINRLIGLQQLAYSEFVAYEKSLSGEIKQLSILSETILSGINYPAVIKKRLQNFDQYHSIFKDINQFHFDFSTEEIPFFYPLLLEKKLDRTQFYQHNLYISTFWQDVLKRNISGFEWEEQLTRNLLPLPIDHRYDRKEIELVIKIIKNFLR